MSDPSVEEVAIEQRATDPRLEQQAAATTESLETPVEITTPEETTTTEEVVPEVVKPPKKTAEEVLKGRVGHLTKTLSAKDEALAAAQARADAAEALLAAGQTQPAGDTPITAKPVAGVYTQADFDAAVAARAEVQEFNRQADAMYNKGAEKFPDWKDAVDTLVVSGFMNKDLIDSAMAVEDGTAVLHYLGTNLDEAERINALTPIRRVAEMAKLSNSLSSPKTIPVSSAPAPIKPITGSPNPSIDLQRLSDDGDMSAYIAARAKQGSRWANARK